MDKTPDNYSQLILKIDEFIRKYYLNKVIRGSIYLSAALFASFIVVTLAEYFGNFSIPVRSVLFYLFILLNAAIFLIWIVQPLFSYFKLGKTINYEQASTIIGQHFSNVKDKLLNILQLKKLSDEHPEHFQLILAGINQKITDLKPVPFSSAIRIKDNRKYIKYTAVPFIIILLIAFTAPRIFSESTERLIKHNVKFVKKAPFNFLILNKELTAIQGQDFDLQVKLSGNEIPAELYVESGANTFKLTKDNIVQFHYTFRNLQEDKQIRLLAGEYSSDPYTIKVKRKPSLLNSKIYLRYPSYTKKKNEWITHPGDLTVPEGTKMEWQFLADNTSRLQLTFNNKKTLINPSAEKTFSYTHTALENIRFTVLPLNEEVKNGDEIANQINVVPDLNPQIEVKEIPDSTNSKLFYFIGNVRDDYGFSKLVFHTRTIVNGEQKKSTTHAIPINKESTANTFLYTLNVNDARLSPGSELEYYFEVYDNDGVNGPKATRSALKTFRLPAEKELEKRIENSSAAVKQKMTEAIKKAAQIERDAKKMKQELYSKNDLEYSEKKQVEQLVEKQKQLEQLVETIKQENRKKISDQEDLNVQSQEMREKQEQIQKLFDNVLDEKTKELLKNIEKLLEQNNKNLTQQELNKMQMDNKSLQKELDRILELYKQLEFEQKLLNTINQLNKTANQQKRLSEESLAENKGKADQAKQKQEDLKDTFENIQQSLKELQNKNQELEQQNDFQNPQKDQEEIENLQEEALKELDKKNLKKAGANQQKAAAQMQQLAQKLQSMQDESEQEENQVNIQSLKEILDNLLTASFEQEKLMETLKKTNINSPDYGNLTVKQKDIKDNLKLVQDSLFSLSAKVPQIQSVVNREIEQINTNIGRTLESLSERKTAEASRSQQYAMTSVNNLALMLSEVLDQLQKAMQNSSQGGKGKKQSLSQLSKMQEQLNRNMDKARQQMQQNAQKGQQQPGSQMSQQFARMAKEQQLIREALQNINKELNKDGKGKLGNLDKLAQEMEQSETDLVNKRIRQETLLRQQEILSKLLDAEKAERERDLDSQRESKQAKEQSPNYKVVLEEYKKAKQKELELLKTVPPALNSFYKLKVGDYFKLLNSNN
ncbi:hypothetical protein [Rubrolithibacter danxiaensis]|uniref:hypothetical protein n=1 Tax=Rubrolithibacter danxiaensis TaxID=3390805 RepID=UPI003BF86944